MSELLRLIKRMGIRRKYVILLLLRSPFDGIRAWMLANLMKTAFLCLETNDRERLPAVCVTYGLICALLFFYNGTIWGLYAAFSAKVEARLQKMMLQKIMSLPLKRVSGDLSAHWLTKLNSDIQAANIMMNGPLNIPHALVSIINTALSSFLMLGSSRLMFVVTWVFILPHLFINYGIVLRHMHILKEESQMAMAESTSVIKPLVAEAETILLYDAGGMMMQKCSESSRRLMKTDQSIHMRNALSSAILRLFGCGGFFVMLIAGYNLILHGVMSLSDVMYCLQVRQSVLAGMFMLFNSINNIKANAVCIKRINTALEE